VKILFLSQRVPYPPNRGDKITTWRLIERMRREHEVAVLAFAHDAADLKAAEDLNAMGIETVPFPHNAKAAKLRSLPLLLGRTPMTLGVYGSRELQRETDRRIAAADVTYAYSSSMGAFFLPHTDARRVMHFAELDSDKWRQYAERTSFPASWVYRREWRTLREFEKRLAHSCEQNVFCTPLEQRIFDEAIPGAPSTVLRNGVDLETFRPAPDEAEPNHLVFTGVMDYYPNIEGCVFFVNEVLPRVRSEFPDARFTIVGAHPTPEVERLAQEPGVTVTGFVDDVRDHMRRASISVAPMHIARGIQNKVLEAMAMGLPVVGTESATQGTDGAAGRDFLLADDAEPFAEAVLGLLRDPGRARELGAQGRRFVEENYDWEVVLRPLDRILTGLPQEEHAAS